MDLFYGMAIESRYWLDLFIIGMVEMRKCFRE